MYNHNFVYSMYLAVAAGGTMFPEELVEHGLTEEILSSTLKFKFIMGTTRCPQHRILQKVAYPPQEATLH